MHNTTPEAQGYVWADGKLLLYEDFKLHGFRDIVFLGQGIFETLRIQGSVIEFYEDHKERLQTSVQMLQLPYMDEVRLDQAVEEVCSFAQTLQSNQKQKDLRWSMRIFYYFSSPTDFFVTVKPLRDISQHITIAVGQWKKPPLPHKVTSYGMQWIDQHSVTADEIVYCNENNEICEGAYTNFFYVQDDVVFTPPLTTGCFPGIIRKKILQHCDAREKTISPEELVFTQEIFLTSSLRHVQHVARIQLSNGDTVVFHGKQQHSNAVASVLRKIMS